MSARRPSVVRQLRDLLPEDVAVGQIVTTGATLMFVIHLGFRAWAAYGGWFYGDDLKFLSEAATKPLTLDYLFTRHQQQLMPGGLMLSWLVGQGAAWSWGLAATSLVVMQAIASLACLAMLRTLFGWRPGILIPFGLYLFSPLTLGAYMWWAAALNQLPLQIAFFGLIATHVTYVRTRRLRWVAASVALLVVALLFYIKSVVVLPVLVLLTLTHVVTGSPRERITTALRRFWPAWSAYAATAAGYLALYIAGGSTPVGTGRNPEYLQTADRQIRETLGPALLGGPWRWLDQGRPDVLSDAPQIATTVTWIVITAVIAGTCWHWIGAWRGWSLLGAYLVPTVYLTASGRTTLFGPEVGLYVRYLSDVSVVACLALALVFLPLRGEPPLKTRSTSPPVSLRPLMAVAMAAVLLGSLWSSVRYVEHWHENSPAERYVQTARNDLAGVDGLAFIDEPVAADLVLEPNAPYDLPSKLLAPLRKDLRPVTRGTDLQMFGSDGQLGPAVVTPGITSDDPEGSDCAVLVKDEKPVTIPLAGTVTDDRWWISISYLASRDGELRVTVGSVSQIHEVSEGPHTIFLTSQSSYDEIQVKSLTYDLGLCINQVRVGFIGTYS